MNRHHHKRRRSPTGFLAAAAALILVASACSSDSDTPMGTVSGKVTLNDKPYADASVVFFSLTTGKGSTGDLQSDGQFTLKDPIPVGKYQVYLAPKAPPPGSEDQPAPVKIDTSVPEKYWNEAATDISVSVEEGPNDVVVPLKK